MKSGWLSGFFLAKMYLTVFIKPCHTAKSEP